jgi:CBS domain-containing protein
VVNTAEFTVRGLVTRPLVTVYPDATLRAVAETMTEETIGAVVVRGEHPPSKPGVRPLGIVSERDIVNAVSEGRNLDLVRAEDAMTMSLAAADTDDALLDVARLMVENEVRHLPLVTDGVVVAVISERDVLRALTAAARGLPD